MAGSQLAMLGATPASPAQIPVLIQQGFTEHQAEPGTRDGEGAEASSWGTEEHGHLSLPYRSEQRLCPASVPWKVRAMSVKHSRGG